MVKKATTKPKSKTANGNASGEVEARREAFKRWLDHNGVNANEAAKLAQISVSAIYNFLNGSTKSLSSTVLNKLALAHNCSVDSIIHGRAERETFDNKRVQILYRVGARGSMFICNEKLFSSAPEGVVLPDGVAAAVIDGDGLAPIPDGWTVFFRIDASEPSTLVNKLATVRFAGGGERPVVRTILPSQHDGLFTLKSLDGSLTEDVKIVAAHEIVSFALTKISEE